MRPPRTFSELMATLGRRQTNGNTNSNAAPSPLLFVQPAISTRSIPGFMTIPTPIPASTPTPSSAARLSTTSSSIRTTPASASTRATSSAVQTRITPSAASPSPSNSEVRGLLPLPSTASEPSATDTIDSDADIPTESAVQPPPPDRGAATVDGASESRGTQIGILVGSLVAVAVIAGILALFCMRRVKKKKAAKAAERAATPDFISRPLARTDSNPWQGPIRATATGGSGLTTVVSSSGSRNSMEGERYDEKQFAPSRSPPPPTRGGAHNGDQIPVPVSRFQSAQGSSGGGSGGDDDQYGKHPTAPLPALPKRESLSKYGPIAEIHEHYAPVGTGGAMPSPLFFRPMPGEARPDSMTFGAATTQYGPRQGER